MSGKAVKRCSVWSQFVIVIVILISIRITIKIKSKGTWFGV